MTISNIERGLNDPSHALFNKLVKALDIPPEELMDRQRSHGPKVQKIIDEILRLPPEQRRQILDDLTRELGGE